MLPARAVSGRWPHAQSSILTLTVPELVLLGGRAQDHGHFLVLTLKDQEGGQWKKPRHIQTWALKKLKMKNPRGRKVCGLRGFQSLVKILPLWD